MEQKFCYYSEKKNQVWKELPQNSFSLGSNVCPFVFYLNASWLTRQFPCFIQSSQVWPICKLMSASLLDGINVPFSYEYAQTHCRKRSKTLLFTTIIQVVSLLNIVSKINALQILSINVSPPTIFDRKCPYPPISKINRGL